MEQEGKKLRGGGNASRDDEDHLENDVSEKPPVYASPGQLPKEPCFSKPAPASYNIKKKLMTFAGLAGAAFSALVGGGSSQIPSAGRPAELAVSTPSDPSQGWQIPHLEEIPPSPSKSPVSRKL